MPTEEQIWKLAEAYVAGDMPEDVATALQEMLSTDDAFAANFHECVNMLRSMKGSLAQGGFRSMLKDIHSEQAAVKKEPRLIKLNTHYLRTAAVAAGVALLVSATTYWAFNKNRKDATQYNTIRREVESIKQSQNALVRSQNQILRDISKPTPTAAVRYTGTGFALTNDGYFVTDYHVVNDGDSVYIQDHNGDYYKASLVIYDEAYDVAVMKIDDKKFRFGKGDVPYTFSNVKAGLGTPVYTLGFPQDEMVYDEGYISVRNGFQGNPMQYGLELHADHGQSGSPVLDAKGNVLALLTAIGNQESNTYAVSSKALVQMLQQSLPKDKALHLPKANKLAGLSRDEQIEKMEPYTFSVKVYKK
jgi:hypothetical protein